MTRTALVTGFDAYGGRARNLSAEIATSFDGEVIGDTRVVGRTLPVAFGALDATIPALLAESDPAVVISLGLCPAEPVIRLERIAINLADFAIPDNEGAVPVDRPLDAEGTAARFATLPLRAIQAALLSAGIPARLSSTAGTYLCNQALYRFLGVIEQRGKPVPCGFVHVPYLPEQVAGMIACMQTEHRVERRRPVDLPSMGLAMMREAARIALEVSLSPQDPA